MKSDTVTPQNLFDKPVRYVVPLFQRTYVWDKDEQWTPLWEDVLRTTEAFDALVAAGTKPEKAVTTAQKHFLGAVVVQSVVSTSKYIPERFVIDGQQRLTTLQLLIDATLRVVDSEGMTQAAAILGGLVRNEDKYHSISDDEFKVWPTNLDRPTYRALMSINGTINYSKLANPTKLSAAHKYFSETIEGWCQSEGDPTKRQRLLESLVTTLRELLQVVEITLDESDNAQVIFETLNARGTPLEASDLVKNYLFRVVEASGVTSAAVYESYWKQFDTQPWRRKVSQGRLYRPRMDVFLQHWLILRTFKDVVATEVFTKFRTYARTKDDDATDILKDLWRMGETWETFDRADPSSRLGTFIYRQRVMQADSVSPLLLWLYDPASPIPPQQQTVALTALESWLVRRMLCRLTTKDYNSLRIEVLTALADVPASDRGAALQTFLMKQDADSRFWPSDEQVRTALGSLPLYRLLTRSRLRMILEGIEDFLRGTKSEEHVVKGKLTIEHVMPQGWEAHWSLPPATADEDTVARRAELLHTIGNLTLLTQSLNSEVSNGPWSAKRKAIADHGVLLLSAPLKVADIWDEAAILARSGSLADAVCKEWPRPTLA